MAQLSLESDLHSALARRELSLVYQPKVSLKTGAVTGVEALLRWQNSHRGAISPAEFIPIAETTGLIHPIGNWVISTACQQLRRWHDQGWELLRVAINLSSVQFKNPQLCQHIASCMLQNLLPPDSLELELTESIVVEDIFGVIRSMKCLKTLGINIAIDDFGTGYSSLKYIHQLPIDILKLDQAFVQNIHLSGSKKAAISKAVIAMAHELNVKVIAEGVSAEGELEFLEKNQVNEVQGYLISPPLSAQDVTAWLNHVYCAGWRK